MARKTEISVGDKNMQVKASIDDHACQVIKTLWRYWINHGRVFDKPYPGIVWRPG
jgi:hypothetical protein